MIVPRQIVNSRLFRLAILMVLVQLGACNLNLGGPQAAAIKYVKEMVEQPENSLVIMDAYKKLPNQVLIDYARALHQQGVNLIYRAEKIGKKSDGIVRIAVSILPDRENAVVKERGNILVLELKNMNNQGWKVIGFEYEP